MLEDLKKQVLLANKLLPKYGLVKLTWGNVSAVDRASGLVIIKPSGVDFEEMTEEDLAVVRLSDGERVEGRLKPSTDLATHLVMYRNFPEMNSIVHTHSRWAVVYAQAGRELPALGTTHADTFYGPIPCTRAMTDEEIAGEYEANTGEVIAETLRKGEVYDSGAVLVKSHGPFVWGKTPVKAVENSLVLEEVADMAWHTEVMTGISSPMQQSLLDKHFLRKHGKDAYYGQ